MKIMKKRQLVSKLDKVFLRRTALFFISVVLVFGLVESGLFLSLENLINTNKFRTDRKIQSLQSEKANPQTILSEESSTQETISNPKGKKTEDITKRTAHSKTYVLNDNTLSTTYSTKQLHYKDGDKWKPVDNSLKKEGSNYARAKFMAETHG